MKKRNNKSEPMRMVIFFVFGILFCTLHAGGLETNSGFDLSSNSNYTLNTVNKTLNVSRTQASFLIAQFQENITELKANRNEVERIEDILSEMRLVFKEGSYNDVYNLYQNSLVVIKKMLLVEEMIDRDGALLKLATGMELNTSGAIYRYNQGVADYRISNFEDSETSLIEAESILMGLLKNKTSDVRKNLEDIKISIGGNDTAIIVDNITLMVDVFEKEGKFLDVILISGKIDELRKALGALYSLNENISVMEDQGYKIERLFDDYNNLRDNVINGQFDEFFKGYNETSKLIEQINNLKIAIEMTNGEIRKPEYSGIDFNETKYYINLSYSEFNLEDYEKAEEFLKEANVIFEKTRQEHAFETLINKAKEKFNFINVLKKSWWQLLLIFLLILILGMVARFFFMIKALNIRLKRLKQEQEVVMELIKKLQRDYYRDFVIDKNTYHSQYKNFDRRITEIKENIPIIEGKIERLSKAVKNAKNKPLGIIKRLRKKEDDRKDKTQV